MTLTPTTQTITFNTQVPSSRNYVHGSTFAISPVATSSSGLPVTHGSSTPTRCTVSGTTVSFVSAGTCTLTASQAGNASYSAATQQTQNVTIVAVTPPAPTIGTGTPGDTTASVSFSAPGNNGGSAILDYTVTCAHASGNKTGVGVASPISVTGMTNLTTYSCRVAARNSAGSGASSGSVNVTPSATPVAPSFTSPAATSFTVLSPGTFNVTASGFPSPSYSIFSGSLPSGLSLNTVTGVISGTPASGTVASYPLTLQASNNQGSANQSFTLTVAKANQTISFTDPDDRQFGLSGSPLIATATSGLAVTFAENTPGVCTVGGTTANLVSVGTCTITATQIGNANYNAASPTVQQSFTITKGEQVITFGSQFTPSRPFNGGTFAISPIASTSSNLVATYTSASPAVCSVSGTTVTMLAIGACGIQANQTGNTNWNPATPVLQEVALTQGSQTINFPSQTSPRNFAPGGTFPITEASASSGLAVVYSSTTPSICTVSGTTVTIVAPGNCIIAANQSGNTNYGAAPQVTQGVTINGTAPGAPTIGTASASASGQLSVSFTAPTNNGGSPIIQYTATCNAASGQGTGSPVIVAGLSNGVTYTCSVTATNAFGTSVPSGTVQGTPSANGPALWATHCASCHGDVPSGARFNAAGTTPTVLGYVIANRAEMVAVPTIQALTSNERADLVAHINSFLQPVTQTVAPNVPKQITVAGHIVFDGDPRPTSTPGGQGAAFDTVEIVSQPSSGSLSAFTGVNATYTPANGFTGSATFQYRGRNSITNLIGDTHTATILVDPNARVLTVSLSPSGAGITFASGPAGTTYCSTTCVEAYNNNDSVTLMAFPDAGYEFGSWSGACTGTGDCVVNMDANKTVTASFVTSQRALSIIKAGTGTGTVTSNPAGINCGPVPTCSAFFGTGSTVTLTAVPSAGSTFTGWSGAGCSGTGTCEVLLEEGQAVTATFTASAVIPTVAHDFNDDGKSDLLYRNNNTGQVYRFFVNGLSMFGGGFVHTEPDTNWKLIHDADFNGDGVADLLWRHAVTGQIYVMILADTGVPAGGAIVHSEPSAAWKIIFTPDIDGDGKADLLWRNTSTGQVYVMLMNGAAIGAQGMAYTEPNLTWTIVAAGDFAGSGKKNQLLWRNSSTGQIYQQTLQHSGGGVFTQSGAIIYSEPDTNWRILAAADFSGDGKSDLVWRHAVTGQVYVMTMNGGAITGGAIVHTEPSTQWQMVAFGDYNGDAKADLLWRNLATGQVYLMLMNGAAVGSQAMMYTEPDTNWKVMGAYEYGQ